MPNFEVLTTNDAAQWQRTLDQCAPYDFYHLPLYHALAEASGEGTAAMFVFREGTYTIALPLLLRDIDPELQAPGWRDATSVYGYVGPLCSQGEIPPAVVRSFQSGLTARLRQLQIVTVFSRLHPFLTQHELLAGLGERRWSRTVSIDLTLDPELQRAQFRRPYRKWINKLRRLGVTVVHDQDFAYLPEFVRVYHENMHRVKAADRYLYSLAYFQQWVELLGSNTHLFMCLRDNRPLCGGLLGTSHGIMQFHFGGTADEAVELSPTKLLVDELRLWGVEQHMRVLHLGGGLTSDSDDPLLHFKQGFSDRAHDFAVWRWVLLPEMHDRLCAAKTVWNEHHLQREAAVDFFPEYRTPTASRVSAGSGNLLKWQAFAQQHCF